MKTKKYIKVLLENGINSNTILKLNLQQIEVLAKRFIVSEQATTPQNTTPIQKPATTSYVVKPNAKTKINGIEIDTTGGKTTATPLKELGENETIDVVNDPDATADGMPTTEGEMNEKFESKAQQGLFWTRCNNSSGKTKEKWCKMAKEFSDSTSKKQYKNMPEKKHPEKSVTKKTKKETNENYEKFLEDSIVEMLDNYINPAMTKGNLVQSVNERKKSESFILNQPKKNTMFSQDKGKEMKTMKRPIGRITSLGEEAKEFKEQTIAPVKPGTKERTKEKGPGKKNPFQPKHNPAPKADKGNIPNWLTWNKLGVNLK